jgi:hypothetical protein
VTEQPAHTSTGLPQRYCALAASTPDSGAGPRGDEEPIVLVMMKGPLPRILINPRWKLLLGEGEWNYFEDLLLDWRQQLAAHPEALFEQMCSLGTGPLIAVRVGSDIISDPTLKALAETFRAL